MNLFKNLAMVGLVGVGMASPCFAQAYYPPYPSDLVNQSSIICISKVGQTTAYLEGSGFFQSKETYFGVILATLLPPRTLKGKLPKCPVALQLVGSETMPLDDNKEYLLFLEQDGIFYKTKQVFPIKDGKVPCYISDTDIKPQTPPPWDEVPVEKAVKSIQGIVKDAGKVNKPSPTPQ